MDISSSLTTAASLSFVASVKVSVCTPVELSCREKIDKAPKNKKDNGFNVKHDIVLTFFNARGSSVYIDIGRNNF